MIESESCISSPITVLKDCSVLGSAACSEKPNENRSHSAPSRRTPNFVRGVNTRRRVESISSKTVTVLRGPRCTSASPTYVPSATYSTERGQNPLSQLSPLSWAKAGVEMKHAAENTRTSDRGAKIFTRSPTSTAVPAKQVDSLSDLFHHH